MEKIVYKTDTGIVCIVTPSASAIRNKYSMDKIIADSNIPENAERKIIDESDMPKDYSEFKGFEGLQSALNYDLTLDVGRAKEIKKAKLRYDRKPLLEAQDIAFMKAFENGNDTADIATEKQRLRDVPQLVDSCKTISAIKKISV